MGTNIIITQPNGNRVPMQNRRTATGITSAKQNWGLNAEDTVDIIIESPFPQTYNIGDKITVFEPLAVGQENRNAPISIYLAIRGCAI